MFTGIQHYLEKFNGAPDAGAGDAVLGHQMPNACRGCRSSMAWGTRCPMFAVDAIFPRDVQWGTRCLIFSGDAKFPSEVY